MTMLLVIWIHPPSGFTHLNFPISTMNQCKYEFPTLDKKSLVRFCPNEEKLLWFLGTCKKWLIFTSDFTPQLNFDSSSFTDYYNKWEVIASHILG